MTFFASAFIFSPEHVIPLQFLSVCSMSEKSQQERTSLEGNCRQKEQNLHFFHTWQVILRDYLWIQYQLSCNEKSWPKLNPAALFRFFLWLPLWPLDCVAEEPLRGFWWAGPSKEGLDLPPVLCLSSHVTVDSCVGLIVVSNEHGNTSFTVNQVTAKIYSRMRSGQKPSIEWLNVSLIICYLLLKLQKKRQQFVRAQYLTCMQHDCVQTSWR